MKEMHSLGLRHEKSQLWVLDQQRLPHEENWIECRSPDEIYTTVDETCPTGAQIPIEERASDEVRGGSSPRDCAVFNPAFDVTPRELITALVLDTGVKQ